MSGEKQHVFVVLGMHRGGTSAVARVLKALGIALGDNLLPPREDNPKGFWEDIESLAINEELLCHFRSAYDRLGLAWRFVRPDPTVSTLKIRAVQLIKRRVSDHGGVWAFKDPRTSRLLPFWREVLDSCGFTSNFVIALRNPLSVALSLKKRNQTSIEKSYFLWLQHMVPAVLDSAGARRLVVDYDLLVDAPMHQVRRISSAFGLNLSNRNDSAIIEYTEEFLEQRLRHTEFALSELNLDCRVPEDVVKAYRLLFQAARDEQCLDAPDFIESFEDLRSRLAAYSPVFDYANELEEDKTDLYETIAKRDARIASLNQILTGHDEQIASLTQAVSEREKHIAFLTQGLTEDNEQIASLQQAASESDARITSLKQALFERDEQIASLEQATSDDNAQIISLKQTLSERDDQIASLTRVVSEHEKQITCLTQDSDERNEQIASLRLVGSEREKRIVRLTQSLEERDAQNASLKQATSEGKTQITSLEQTLSERDEQIASLTRAASEREKQITSLTQGLEERNQEIPFLKQSVSERTEQTASLKQALAEREDQIENLRILNLSLTASMSWRITSPLRSVYGLLLNALKASRAISERIRLARRVRVQPTPPKPDSAEPQSVLADSMTGADWEGDYVEDTPPPPHFNPDVRLVAFYLPQFHPIPENDRLWGKGFTEWTNVVRARPQFKEHYQPHLPGELGFYDLRVKDVQIRQVALARRYGIGAFCFYFYWFGNKQLLEFPIRQYLDSPELTLPFCLCWANENWTRDWDGAEGEVLVAQNHGPDDDIAFIEHIGQYMRDSRYLRINGCPVLLVYRPSLLPDIRATVHRWREWAKGNGFPDLYLIYPQSFEIRDPAEYGFDAATEFPPNLSGPPILTDQIQRVDPTFSGIVYDWRIFVERSQHYSVPAYKIFRGVCPSWDNEPRRPGRGTVFLHSSPEGYRAWLQNALADTRRRLKGDERLIFVNAWNEWAESAHLEPDQRYGYAWLQSTREALMAPRSDVVLGRVVIVTHDAYPHGSQFIALNITRELSCSLRCEVEVVCLGDGPLKAEFAKYALVHDLADAEPGGPKARQLAADLFERGFHDAFVNTTVCGKFLATLKQTGMRCVALVHELREIILSYKLEAHAETLAEYADHVVFPATEVEDSFHEFASISPDKVTIRPQGLFKPNPYTSGDLIPARRALRQKLGLSEDALIILGVGYGDRRKGVDYFVEIAGKVVAKDARAHFVWVGSCEPAMQRNLATLAKQSPSLFHHVHLVGYQGDTAVYYAGADAFALTSREDPFPCVVLEAMDVGLPIIAFMGSGGSPRLIDEGLGENVPMGDCAAFAEATLRLLGDGASRQRITRLARVLLTERFSFRHYVFELLKLTGIPVRRVSVVVPNFNYERYLADRITTILNQTYPIYEVIFLDDASHDNSVALAGRLLANAGVDYQILPNQINSGSLSLQWKLGTERARGDIVWIAEADDQSEPDFVSTVLRGFDDPGVVLSYCESKQIDRDGQLLAQHYGEYLSDLGCERWEKAYINDGEAEIRNYLAVKNTIPNVSAVLMRREDLARVLSEYINDIRCHKVAGDWKTYLYLLPKGRLAFSPQALNLHRRHRGGVTISAFNESHFREIQEIQEWVADHYRIPATVRQSMRRYLAVLRKQFGLRPEIGDRASEESSSARA